MNRWKNWTAEQLSSRVLYVLIAIAVVIFALFWLVGFDRPFADNPNFVAPLFTDAVMMLMEVLLVCAIAFTLWAAGHALKVRGKGESLDNGVPVKKIGYGLVFGTMLLLIGTFLLGSSSEMTINGVKYADTFWLKTSDMLIYTSLLMMLAAVAAVIFGSTRYYRRK